MPRLLQFIDKIAREKQRDVLMIEFDREIYPDYDYDQWEVRAKFMDWLEQNNLSYTPCGCFASENSMESYRGQLYIDVPYDEQNPDYQKLCQHLEHADGSMKIKGLLFCYVSLEIAMKNKHHDEEGFWEKWAEDF